MSDLTFKFAQQHQPWTLPYAAGVIAAEDQGDVPHILGSHCALHAAKSAGKLCAAFEKADHTSEVGEEQRQVIRDMSADLVTAALRFANLYGFDLATELDRRVREKNGKGYAP